MPSLKSVYVRAAYQHHKALVMTNKRVTFSTTTHARVCVKAGSEGLQEATGEDRHVAVERGKH
jgi:hypothetical protein